MLHDWVSIGIVVARLDIKIKPAGSRHSQPSQSLLALGVDNVGQTVSQDHDLIIVAGRIEGKARSENKVVPQSSEGLVKANLSLVVPEPDDLQVGVRKADQVVADGQIGCELEAYLARRRFDCDVLEVGRLEVCFVICAYQHRRCLDGRIAVDPRLDGRVYCVSRGIEPQ